MLQSASPAPAAALPMPELYRRVERHIPPLEWRILADDIAAILQLKRERNAVVLVQPDGRVFDIQKNDSKGPLEFPTAVVFVEATAYVSNFDTARRDNHAADGKTSIDGIGASIIKIEQ